MADRDRKRLRSEASNPDHRNGRKRTKHDGSGASAGDEIPILPTQFQDNTASKDAVNYEETQLRGNLGRRASQKVPKYKETKGSGPEDESDDPDGDEFILPKQGRKRPASRPPGESQEVKNAAVEIAEEKAKLVAAALIILKITDSDMIEWNAKLHLPMKAEYPTQATKDGKRGDHQHNTEKTSSDRANASRVPKVLYASTISQEVLTEKGGWDFTVGGERMATTKDVPPEGRHKPINLNGGKDVRVSWDDAPFQVDANSKIMKRIDRPIKNLWKWLVARIIDTDSTLEVPISWNALAEPSDPRPELPSEYALLTAPIPQPSKSRAKKENRKAIRKATKLTDKTASQRSNMADTPETVDAKAPSSPDTPKTTSKPHQVPVLVQSNVPQSSTHNDSLSNEARDLRLDGAVSGSLEQEEVAERNPFKCAESTADNVVDTLATLLIRKHNLKPQRSHALLLEKLLKPYQLIWDRAESKRDLCRLLNSMEANRKSSGNEPVVKYVDDEYLAEQTDKGSIALTTEAPHVGDSGMKVAYHWVEFGGLSPKDQGTYLNQHNQWQADFLAGNVQLDDTPEKGRSVKSPAELEIERSVGSCFMGLFKFDSLEEYSGVALSFPEHLRQYDIIPFPDYAVRPVGPAWKHWPKLLAPCVGSSDAKPFQGWNKNWEAQLALNSLSTLIIMICMYLDSRETAEEMLPPWMFIPSWVYTELGFTLYIHYPSAELDDEKTWVWRFQSLQLTNTYTRLWSDSLNNHGRRVQSLAAMIRVRAHTAFVLEQIRLWTQKRAEDRSSEMVNRLMDRAYYEEKNYKWVVEKAGLEWKWGATLN